MTNRERAEKMDRARAKRRTKKGTPPSPPEPDGVVEQVTKMAGEAARSVGKAVKSATDALTGG
jgi:hypothetical protein